MNTQVFGSFVSSAPQSKQLPEGTWAVYVYMVEQTNSFLNGDGSVKIEERPWSNPARQVIVKFFCPERKEWHTHRLSLDAFRKSDTLTKAELKAGKLEAAGRYVVDAKTKERIIDEAGVEKCNSIINEFFHALKMEEGSTDISAAIAEKRLLNIKIANKPYLDEEQLKVVKFSQYKEPVEKEDFSG